MTLAIALILGLFFFILFNFLYFILPSLSPIPFFPSNSNDVSTIVDNLLYEGLSFNSKNTKSGRFKSVIDLGAGTGTVIFAAANVAYKKNLPVNFIAVEIHPLLIFILYLRRLFHPFKKNIQIIRRDIFKLDLNTIVSAKSQKTIYLYVGTPALERLKSCLEKLPPHTRIVSYMYAIAGWEKKLLKKHEGKIHPIYEYVN